MWWCSPLHFSILYPREECALATIQMAAPGTTPFASLYSCASVLLVRPWAPCAPSPAWSPSPEQPVFTSRMPRRHLRRLTDWDQPSCDLRRHSTALHQQHWLQPKVILSAPSSSTPARGRAVFEGWRSVMASGPAIGLDPQVLHANNTAGTVAPP